MKMRFCDLSYDKICRILLGCCLLATSACGLSDYEKRMEEAQKREERFREENKYLDEPVKIPTQKNKDGQEVPLAEAFFRPPKGTQSSGEVEGNKLFWRYRPSGSGSTFPVVALAFASDNNTFLEDVMRIYPRTTQAWTPQRATPLPFESWEYDEDQYTYSVNVSQNAPKVAVVFIFGKGRANELRKIMDLSLQSLAVGQEASAAQLRYKQKSPWKLENKPSS
jgi:hypothetical protein